MRIALIHALKHSIAPIETEFDKSWPQAQRMNLLDDTLSQDVARDGRITPAMTARFLTLARYAVDAGAAGILFTCSAFGECIDACKREFPDLPILKPTEAMIDDTLAFNGRIGLLASFPPTLASMVPEFQERAPNAPLTPRLIEGAMAALDAGDAQRHDALAVATARTLPEDCAVIALAQFSLARAQSMVQNATGKTVLTTPGSAVARLKRLLA